MNNIGEKTQELSKAAHLFRTISSTCFFLGILMLLLSLVAIVAPKTDASLLDIVASGFGEVLIFFFLGYLFGVLSKSFITIVSLFDGEKEE